jgi:hypothetical protein
MNSTFWCADSAGAVRATNVKNPKAAATCACGRCPHTGPCTAVLDTCGSCLPGLPLQEPLFQRKTTGSLAPPVAYGACERQVGGYSTTRGASSYHSDAPQAHSNLGNCNGLLEKRQHGWSLQQNVQEVRQLLANMHVDDSEWGLAAGKPEAQSFQKTIYPVFAVPL